MVSGQKKKKRKKEEKKKHFPASDSASPVGRRRPSGLYYICSYRIAGALWCSGCRPMAAGHRSAHRGVPGLGKAWHFPHCSPPPIWPLNDSHDCVQNALLRTQWRRREAHPKLSSATLCCSPHSGARGKEGKGKKRRNFQTRALEQERPSHRRRKIAKEGKRKRDGH